MRTRRSRLRCQSHACARPRSLSAVASEFWVALPKDLCAFTAAALSTAATRLCRDSRAVLAAGRYGEAMLALRAKHAALLAEYDGQLQSRGEAAAAAAPSASSAAPALGNAALGSSTIISVASLAPEAKAKRDELLRAMAHEVAVTESQSRMEGYTMEIADIISSLEALPCATQAEVAAAAAVGRLIVPRPVAAASAMALA